MKIEDTPHKLLSMIMYCFPSPHRTDEVANKTEQFIHSCRPFLSGRVWTPVPVLPLEQCPKKGTGFAGGDKEKGLASPFVSLPCPWPRLFPRLWGWPGSTPGLNPGAQRYRQMQPRLRPVPRGLKGLPRGPTPQPRRQGPSGARLARLQPWKRGASGWARRADLGSAAQPLEGTGGAQELLEGTAGAARPQPEAWAAAAPPVETPWQAALPGAAGGAPLGADPAAGAPSVRCPSGLRSRKGRAPRPRRCPVPSAPLSAGPPPAPLLGTLRGAESPQPLGGLFPFPRSSRRCRRGPSRAARA